MRDQGIAVGFASGLVLALALVAGANALGPSILHISLIPVSASPIGTMSVPGASETSGQASVAQYDTGTPSHSFSSLNSLSSEGGLTIGLVFLPVLIGALSGAALYTLAVRRVEPD